MQDADLDSVNDGLSEALASIPSEPAPEPASEAPAATESEASQSRDERGRFKSEAERASEAPKAADPDEGEGGRVPAWRLREIREERDQIAAKAEAAERRALEAERRWEAHQRQLQQQQAPQRPDPSYDPEAYAEYVEQTVGTRVQSVQEEARQHFVNLAFDMAIDQHGQEAVDAAMKALEEARDKQAADEIRTAVNPAKALLKWHSRHRARVEVGDDIDGFKKNHRSQLMADPEFRKEFMAAMEAEARGGSPARSSDNVTSLPSLNRAPGGGGRQTLGDLGSSDQEMFQSLTRKRR